MTWNLVPQRTSDCRCPLNNDLSFDPNIKKRPLQNNGFELQLPKARKNFKTFFTFFSKVDLQDQLEFRKRGYQKINISKSTNPWVTKPIFLLFCLALHKMWIKQVTKLFWKYIIHDQNKRSKKQQYYYFKTSESISILRFLAQPQLNVV
jgi:hypothetical protein